MKEKHKETKNTKARKNYEMLRGLGYPYHVSMVVRYWKEERVEEFLKTYRPEDFDFDVKL